jgi:hypothetical protein
MIKHFIFRTILRCKYHVGFSTANNWSRKYFWRLSSAIKFADTLPMRGGASIVWRNDHKPMHTARNGIDYSIHPDANNFNPYQ